MGRMEKQINNKKLRKHRKPKLIQSNHSQKIINGKRVGGWVRK